MLALSPEWHRLILHSAVSSSHDRAVDGADNACWAVGLFAGEEKAEAEFLAWHLLNVKVLAEFVEQSSDRVTNELLIQNHFTNSGELQCHNCETSTLEKSNTPILSGVQTFHNYIRPQMTLNGQNTC